MASTVQAPDMRPALVNTRNTAKPKKNPLSDGQGTLASLLVSPTMLIILLVVGIPIILSLRESVFRRNAGIDPNTGMVAQGESFVGMQNFTDIFANPQLVPAAWGNLDRLLNAFVNTTFFTIVCVALETTTQKCLWFDVVIPSPLDAYIIVEQR